MDQHEGRHESKHAHGIGNVHHSTTTATPTQPKTANEQTNTTSTEQNSSDTSIRGKIGDMLKGVFGGPSGTSG
ncbi:hypothetical protein K7432_004156 [Basidiobolus ranarum]|uniref:Dehydrin n=1 Tax=Basidiobolus ranarum TaxID=34480 RepID=A0ABR2WYT4_9FUNG